MPKKKKVLFRAGDEVIGWLDNKTQGKGVVVEDGIWADNEEDALEEQESVTVLFDGDEWAVPQFTEFLTKTGKRRRIPRKWKSNPCHARHPRKRRRSNPVKKQSMSMGPLLAIGGVALAIYLLNKSQGA